MENWVIKKTTRGIRLIDGKGYSYTKDRSVGLKSYWRCDYKYWKCKSRASLDGPMDNTLGQTRVMFNLMTHGHPPQMKRLIKRENGVEETVVQATSPEKSVLRSRLALGPKSPPKHACAASSEVCLRWNSYQSNMQSVFPNLKDTQAFVDLTLHAEGQLIKCHKVILSSCSNYFAEILKHTNIHQEAIIVLHGIKFWQIKALVDFIYKGEVNVEHGKLDALLKAGGELQIKGLLREEVAPTNSPEADESDAEYYLKPDPSQPVQEDDDEDYYPNPEYKKKSVQKPKRKRRQTVSPPDPSVMKQVKINLKGTKSRPNIKQPKYYSPDYPEYNPDRSVSPPKLDSDPVFDIDNVKMEPLDMEVPASPTYLEMSIAEDDAVAEPLTKGEESPQRYGMATLSHVTADSDLAASSYVYQAISGELTPPSKKNEPEPAVASTSKGLSDSFAPGKKIVLEGPNKRKIIVQRSTSKSDAVYLKDLDLALKNMQVEVQGQKPPPVIRVRHLPAQTPIKKFTSLTSILKKGEPTSAPLILKKFSQCKAPSLAKPAPPAPSECEIINPIYIKDEPASDDDFDDDMQDIETLDDDDENFESIQAEILVDDAETSGEQIILPD